MLGSTGRTCTLTGSYESVDGCKQRIVLRADDIFPPCPGCGRAVSWRLDRNSEVKKIPPSR